MAEISTDVAAVPTAPPVPQGADSVAQRAKHRSKRHREPLADAGNAPNAEPHQGQSFFDELRQIPEEDWDRLGWRLYLYRRWPRINKSDQPHYLDCVRHAIDEASLLETYGSGRYTIRLNNARKTIKTHVCEVHNLDRPPKIDLAELVDCEENRRYFELWPDKKGKEAKANGASGGDPVAELTKLIGKMVERNGQQSPEGEKLTTTLVNWALTQTAEERKAERDGDSPSKLTELVKAIKELNPSAPTSGDSPMLQFVLGELKETRAQHAEEMKEMRKQHADLMNQLISLKGEQTKQPSTLEQVKQMGEVISTFASVIPQATPMEPWQQMLVDTVPKATDMVEKLITMNAMNRRMPQAPRPGTPPQNPQPQPGVTVASPPVQANAGTPPAPPNPNPAVPAPQVPEMDIMTKTLLVAIGDNAVAALKLGMAGDEFAERLCDNFGPRTYDNFIEQNPKETLLPLFASIPEAWTLLQPFEPVLPRFLDEFYAYADEEPPKEAPAPPAVTESAKAKAKPAAKVKTK